jgi:hypothetical protein
MLGVTNGSLVIPDVGTTVKVTQTTGRGGIPGTVDIGTGEEDISFGDTVPGYIYVRNLDGTNYVQLGPKDSGAMIPFLKLKAGEQALFRLDGSVTIRGKATGGTVKVLFMAVND